MSKKSHFTTVTALPAGISRATVLETLHDHFGMIDLNPLVTERHPIHPPPEATAEEYHCKWYSVTDKVNYLPGGLYSGSVTFNGCFHDLPDGLQTHIYAPMGLNMKGRWTLGGSLPGEPRQPVEIGLGVPKTGLWLREDVEMKCNMVMTTFVKKTTKKTHSTLVDRLVEKAHLTEAEVHNTSLFERGSVRSSDPPEFQQGRLSSHSGAMHSPPLSDSGYEDPMGRRSSSIYDGRHPYQSYNVSVNNQSINSGYQDSKHAYGHGGKTNSGSPYPSVDPLFHNANAGHTQHAVELPSQEMRQPMELDGNQRRYRQFS